MLGMAASYRFQLAMRLGVETYYSRLYCLAMVLGILNEFSTTVFSTSDDFNRSQTHCKSLDGSVVTYQSAQRCHTLVLTLSGCVISLLIHVSCLRCDEVIRFLPPLRHEKYFYDYSSKLKNRFPSEQKRMSLCFLVNSIKDLPRLPVHLYSL